MAIDPLGLGHDKTADLSLLLSDLYASQLLLI